MGGMSQVIWDEPSTSEAPDVEALSKKYGLDPEIIKKQIQQESGGKQDAVSPKGAIGMMQLMPETAKRLGVDPRNPQQNLEGGLREMQRLHQKYGGDYRKVLAAYNAGEERVDSGRALPSETQNYVKAIMGEEKPPQVKWDAPKMPVTKPATKPAEAPKDQTYFQGLDKASEELQATISRWRPRWDRPEVLQQDPTWYGRSAKYAGGEAIGAGKATAGVAIGMTKLLGDVIAAVDPIEAYKRPAGEPMAQLGKDVYGVGQGFIDIGKATYDLIRHFPEASADPEAFGNTVMNMAMTVDGGIKGTKAVMEHGLPTLSQAQDASLQMVQGLKPAVAEALVTAKKASSHAVDGLLRQKAVEDAYVHKNGVGVAKSFVKANKEASKAVDADVAMLRDNIPTTEGVDADQLRQDILDAHADRVRTPDPLDPTLNQLVTEAQKLPPGPLPWEEARQFRSKIGMALSNSKGANKAVLSASYKNLTGQLRGIARDYDMVDRWDHYNELERKQHSSFPILETAKDIVENNGEGARMATALKDKAATTEVLDSLGKYGLDKDPVLKYSKKANQALKNRVDSSKSLFRLVYSRPGAYVGLPAAIATRAIIGGGPEGYAAGIGVGSLAALGTTYLIHSFRAARLSADLLDGILDSREWPGKLAPSQGIQPTLRTGGEPEVAGPEPSPTAPSPTPTPIAQLPDAPTTLQGPTPQAATMPLPTHDDLVEAMLNKGLDHRFAEQRATQLLDAASGKAGYSGTERRSANPLIKHYMGTERRGVTKVPEGEHGTGKIARQAKQRERVAKVRKEKGSTALGGGTQEISGGDVAGEIAKAQERIAAPHLNVENLQIPEMEEALQRISPKDFKTLQGLRKKGQLPDVEYQEGLRAFLLYAYEDQINGKEK